MIKIGNLLYQWKLKKSVKKLQAREVTKWAKEDDILPLIFNEKDMFWQLLYNTRASI